MNGRLKKFIKLKILKNLKLIIKKKIKSKKGKINLNFSIKLKLSNLYGLRLILKKKDNQINNNRILLKDIIDNKLFMKLFL